MFFYESTNWFEWSKIVSFRLGWSSSGSASENTSGNTHTSHSYHTVVVVMCEVHIEPLKISPKWIIEQHTKHHCYLFAVATVAATFTVAEKKQQWQPPVAVAATIVSTQENWLRTKFNHLIHFHSYEIWYSILLNGNLNSIFMIV